MTKRTYRPALTPEQAHVLKTLRRYLATYRYAYADLGDLHARVQGRRAPRTRMGLPRLRQTLLELEAAGYVQHRRVNQSCYGWQVVEPGAC